MSNTVRRKTEYHYKNPTFTFLCPLCGTQRSIKYRPHLSILNYIQILFLSALSIYLLYPYMSFRAGFVFFIYWLGFEATVRLLFKKDLPCPHCGFDASWYKRDVRVTRQKVEEFWQAQQAKLQESSAEQVKEGDSSTSSVLHTGENGQFVNEYLS